MKKCVYCTTAKLSSKKRKNSSFTKKKSLVGSTPELFVIRVLSDPHLGNLAKLFDQPLTRICWIDFIA